jgi:hypothetical protein
VKRILILKIYRKKKPENVLEIVFPPDLYLLENTNQTRFKKNQPTKTQETKGIIIIIKDLKK